MKITASDLVYQNTILQEFLLVFLVFFARVIILNQWSYKIGRGLAQAEITILAAHFVNKTIRGQLDLVPSHAPFFPKFSDQNFEIAIWISIVETSNNHASGDDTALQVFGGRVVSYEIFWLFTYSICYWEFNSHSEERVIFLRGELFPRGDFSWGEMFLGMNF